MEQKTDFDKEMQRWSRDLWKSVLAPGPWLLQMKRKIGRLNRRLPPSQGTPLQANTSLWQEWEGCIEWIQSRQKQPPDWYCVHEDETQAFVDLKYKETEKILATPTFPLLGEVLYVAFRMERSIRSSDIRKWTEKLKGISNPTKTGGDHQAVIDLVEPDSDDPGDTPYVSSDEESSDTESELSVRSRNSSRGNTSLTVPATVGPTTVDPIETISQAAATLPWTRTPSSEGSNPIVEYKA
jgi:hypothetical protein